MVDKKDKRTELPVQPPEDAIANYIPLEYNKREVSESTKGDLSIKKITYSDPVIPRDKKCSPDRESIFHVIERRNGVAIAYYVLDAEDRFIESFDHTLLL